MATVVMVHNPGPCLQNQGIEGQILEISGNQMPSPSIKPSAPKGIRTMLYIFELTTLDQVTRQANTPFYSAVSTRLVQTAWSDTAGYFKVQLKAGRYSLFTRNGRLYYANLFDGENHIAPVEVYAGKMTKTVVKIDALAHY